MIILQAILIGLALIAIIKLIPNGLMKTAAFAIICAVIAFKYGYYLIIFLAKSQYALAVLFAGAMQFGISLGINEFLRQQTKRARTRLNNNLELGKKGRTANKLSGNPYNIFSYKVDFTLRFGFIVILLLLLGIFGASVLIGLFRALTAPIFWFIAVILFFVLFVRNERNPVNNYIISVYTENFISNSVFMIIFVNLIGSQVFAIFGKSNAFAAFLLNCISSTVCGVACYIVLWIDNVAKREFQQMVRFACMYRFCQLSDKNFEYLVKNVKEIEDLSEHPKAIHCVEAFEAFYPSRNFSQTDKYSKLLNESHETWRNIYGKS